MVKGKGAGAPKKPKQQPKVAELTDDQRYSLTEQHREHYEGLVAAKKAADNAVTAYSKVIKADLGKDGLKDIKDVILADTPEGEAKLKAEIERKARVLRWLGFPIGTQAGLFAEPDRRPIDDRAFAEGKRQGLAGETNSNPHHHTTSAHKRHNEGHAEGQGILSKGFKKIIEPEAMPHGEAADSLATAH